MRKLLLFFSTLFFLNLSSQVVLCPDTAIYFQNGTAVWKYNPSLPTSAANPVLTFSSIPGQGLAIANNLNGSGPSPTFYTTSGGNYMYWNGSSWVNTGHSTGTTTAVNPAGGGCYIYNLVGGTGAVYRYNGSGNGTFLVTIPGFSGGGPYDLAADVGGSFFAIKTTSPQAMYHYDETGNLLIQFSMTGMPNVVAGGGLAVFGNDVYVSNSSGFFKGKINFTTISFTNVASPPSQLSGASDFANCATLSTGFLSYAFNNSGPWNCSNSNVNLNAAGWPASTTYSWSGPSLSGPTTNSTAVANSGGLYNCTITAPGNCPTVLSTSVSATSGGTLTIATNSLSNPICQNSSVTFTAAGASNYTWTSSSNTVTGTNFLMITPSVTTTYTVAGSTSSCVSMPVALTVSVVVCSGFEESAGEPEVLNLNVFPNPNSGAFTISATEPMTLQLMNELGQQIRTINLEPQTMFKYELSGLSDGVYFMIDQRTGTAFRNKIVVISR
jgi:hypothetical protein